MKEWENISSPKEWEDYFAKQNERTRKIFNKIIWGNKEFQGEWLGKVIEYLGDAMLYEGDNEDFIHIEVNSQRTRLFVLLLKMAIKKVNDMGSGVDDDEARVLISDYYGLAQEISYCAYNRIGGSGYQHKDINDDNDVTEFDIDIQTKLISNYHRPIESEITGKEGTKKRNLINTDSVNDALTRYLESEIRDIEIDRLLLTLLADSEIVGFIADVGKSKFWSGDDNPIKKLFFKDGNHPYGRLEREEKRLSSVKDIKSGRITTKLFLQYAGISVTAVLFSYLFDFIPSGFGIGVSIFMFILWLYFININKKTVSSVDNNFEKHFPILTMINKMEDFYIFIRQESPLPVSSIKKELNILENAEALMPAGMMSIIEDLEDREVKWI